ncbi:MAG: hypothetical protein KC635_29835, partial [Myxococcales bacterium]|nr:hypothetical protein [Myxococcales bacterium]
MRLVDTCCALLAAGAVIAGVACGSAPPTPVSEEASPPAATGPPTEMPERVAPCLPASLDKGPPPAMERARVGGRTLRFCRREALRGPACYAFDIESGALSMEEVPADFDEEPDFSAPVPREVVVAPGRRSLQVCDASNEKCERVDLGKGAFEVSGVAANADHTRLVVVTSVDESAATAHVV